MNGGYIMIERTIRKLLLTQTLQERLQHYLLLRNSPNNVNLQLLFQKN